MSVEQKSAAFWEYGGRKNAIQGLAKAGIPARSSIRNLVGSIWPKLFWFKRTDSKGEKIWPGETVPVA